MIIGLSDLEFNGSKKPGCLTPKSLPAVNRSILKRGVQAAAKVDAAVPKAGITPPHAWPVRKAWLRFDTGLRGIRRSDGLGYIGGRTRG